MKIFSNGSVNMMLSVWNSKGRSDGLKKYLKTRQEIVRFFHVFKKRGLFFCREKKDMTTHMAVGVIWSYRVFEVINIS